MKKLIKKICIILMILVFFISTTGFTLYIHNCSCYNITKHVIFNELIKSKPGCCCEETTKNIAKEEIKTTFANSDCCHNEHILIKSSTYMLPVFLKLSENKAFKLISFFIPLKTVFFTENKTIFVLLASYFYPPPLLYGRLLIIFHNQFKVPLSV